MHHLMMQVKISGCSCKLIISYFIISQNIFYTYTVLFICRILYLVLLYPNVRFCQYIQMCILANTGLIKIAMFDI